MRLLKLTQRWGLRLPWLIGMLLLLYGMLAATGLQEYLWPEWSQSASRRSAGISMVLSGLCLMAECFTHRLMRLLSVACAALLLLYALFLLAMNLNMVPVWGEVGQIYAYAAIGFALVGVYFLILRMRHPLLTQALVFTVFTIGLVNALGYVLGLETPYHGQVALFVTPWTTALGMLLLSVGMAMHGARLARWDAYYRHREDRSLTAVATFIVLVAVMTAGVAGIGLMAKGMLSVQDEALQSRIRQDGKLIHAVLEEAVLDLDRSLFLVGALQRNEDAASLLRRINAQHPGQRATAVSITFDNGRTLHQGNLHSNTSAKLIPVLGGRAEVVWEPLLTVVIHERMPVQGGGGASITLESSLHQWDPSVFLERNFGLTGETLYCARVNGAIHCLPTRFYDQPFTAPESLGGVPIPMARALNGEAGLALARDYRGQVVKAAYMPVEPGIGIVNKLDVSELLAPAQRWLWSAALAIFILTGLGGGALYLVLSPLARSLRMHRQKYQSILMHAPSAMITCDESGCIRTFNTQAELVFGMNQIQAQGLALESLFSDPEVMILLRSPALLERQSLLCTARRGDGSEFPASLGLSHYRFDQRLCLVAVVNDLSAQRARQQTLETWEAVFQSASWGVVISDPQQNILLNMNPAFARMHGYSIEELIGSPMVDVFSPRAREALSRHIQLAHQMGHHVFESMHLRKDGREFPVQVDVSVIYDERREPRLRIVSVQDITQRKEMERRLRESEQMRRLVLDAQRDLIVRWHPDFSVAFANLACAEAFGETPDSMVGKSWPGLLTHNLETDGEMSELLPLLDQLLERPRRMDCESTIRHTQAGNLRIGWTIVPIYRSDKVLEGFQASGHDITSRKASEAAVAESERWFRAVFDSSFQLSAVLDLQGRFVVLNPCSINFLGCAPDELIGTPIWELPALAGYPESRERMRQAVADAIAGEAPRMELSGDDKFGNLAICDCSLRPVRGEGGKVDFLVAESVDVTLQRHQALQLRERDARLQGIADSMPGVAFEFYRDADAVRMVYISRSALNLYGVDAEALVEGRHSMLDILHPDDRNRFVEALDQSERNMSEMQWSGRLQQREDVWISLHAMPRVIGGQLCWSGVGLNISDMKEKEREVEESHAALRELSAHYEIVREDERRRMAREIHDELGQKLTALRMGLAVLATREAEFSLVQEATRLKGLTDQSIAAVRGIATTLRPAALDLGIVEALGWLASEFEANTGVRCMADADVAETVPEDDIATGLFRIAQESLTNVARHARASHVWIRLRRINHYLVLEVGDDGAGFVVDSLRREAGKGFGLFGMHERALMLGGEMSVTSAPGEGTVVSVRVPIRR